MNQSAVLDGVMPTGTSAGGALLPRSVAAAVVLVSTAFASITSSSDPRRTQDGIAFLEIASTSAGAPQATESEADSRGARANPTSSSPSILELRQLSGLTWDQMSRVLGVARRSLHFWASGKPMTPANEERLQRVLAVVRKADRGNIDANRRVLLHASSDGEMALDLLADSRFEEAERLLGRGDASRRAPRRPAVGEAARVGRRPPALVDRLDTRHEPIHRDIGPSRPARPARRRK